jgi:hypothetical protein
MSSTICYPDSTDWACADEDWLTGLDPEVKARAEMLAWSTLVSLSGYQFSICPITVRPCAAGCLPVGTYYASPAMLAGGTYAGVRPTGRSGFTPHVAPDGNWVNACGCAAADCSCTVLSEVILPGPVGGVTEILIDGAVLDPLAYRVDNGNRLVRLDGGVWPACQDMANPGSAQYEPVVIDGPTAVVTFTREGQEVTMLVDPKAGLGGTTDGPLPWPTEPANLLVNASMGQGNLTFPSGPGFSANHGPIAESVTVKYLTSAAPAEPSAAGTFLVTYYRGVAPNALLDFAAGVLAQEYALACLGSECRLPSNVTAITRQGVSYQMNADPFVNGFTGIDEVDAVLRIYNPYGLRSAPVIASPDARPRGRVTTWSV